MKIVNRTVRCMILCGLVSALGSVSQAFVFNFENDFSKTTNSETSTWSYRWKDGFTRDGNYALLPFFHSDSGWPFVPTWQRLASDSYPFIGVSDSTGQSQIHPLGAPDGSGLAVVSWLSPLNGTVNVAIQVTAVGGGSIEYYADKGNAASNLVSGTISGGGSTCRMRVPNVPVCVGDRLNFIIGPNGDYYDDSTRMFVEVTDEAIPIELPAAPARPEATMVATNQLQVDLHWIDQCNFTGNVVGYKIERAPDESGNPGMWVV
jgi:hypothetical protein